MSDSVKTIYRCGSLSYTKRGIVTLFVWLLWGDFCITVMTKVEPVLVPLMLKMHDASNLTIGLLCGSIPAMLNFIINPIISTASDRTRTRWGRRIPFMLAGTPFVSLFLIILGFSDEIGTYLVHWFSGQDADPSLFIIALLAVLSVGYCFFNLFAGCVYYYVFSDVVPRELTGRFLGFFRVVGSCGGLLFNLAIMPYVETHMGIVCLLTGVLYCLGFGAMCCNVKEGEYPPPPPKKGGFVSNIKIYAKECFAMPYWMILFIGLGLNYASTVCRTLFNLLYAMENLHITSAQYGFIMAAYSAVTMVLAIPIGFLCDKFHPLRIYIAAAWLVIFVNIAGFFFCINYLSFFIISILLAVVYVAQEGSRLPLAISLYPREKFGQFGSAASMVKAIMMVTANAAGGWFIDLLGYQYLFIWDLIFTLASVLILHWIYIRWKALGGDENYIAPQIKQA